MSQNLSDNQFCIVEKTTLAWFRLANASELERLHIYLFNRLTVTRMERVDIWKACTGSEFTSQTSSDSRAQTTVTAPRITGVGNQLN